MRKSDFDMKWMRAYKYKGKTGRISSFFGVTGNIIKGEEEWQEISELIYWYIGFLARWKKGFVMLRNGQKKNE